MASPFPIAPELAKFLRAFQVRPTCQITLHDSIFGYYWDNGKEHGSYYIIIGLYREYCGYIGILEKNMEATTLE